MKYVFTGTDACPDEITLRGVKFKKGKAEDVADDNFAAKLDALEYFKRAPGRPKKAAADA